MWVGAVVTTWYEDFSTDILVLQKYNQYSTYAKFREAYIRIFFTLLNYVQLIRTRDRAGVHLTSKCELTGTLTYCCDFGDICPIGVGQLAAGVRLLDKLGLDTPPTPERLLEHQSCTYRTIHTI